MLIHTYERALEATKASNIFVATDSNEIMNLCKKESINCIMTSDSCLTGTDRIAEFAEKIRSRVYVNLQGDEPIMNSDDIKKVIDESIREPNIIINGYAPIKNKIEYLSRNIPKVVLKANGDLMYMSRSPIPGNKLNKFFEAKKQICVYSFPIKALQFLSDNPNKSFVENIEDIEILRFIELGWNVKMVRLSGDSVAVDTPDDLERVRKIMKNRLNK